MWGYLRLRWWLSETSKNTTPPRAPNGTKKGRCRTKKRPIQKKGHYRTSPLKNGLTKLPCFLKILVSWGDFFDNGLLLYPVQDHTMQCCTRKPFWVAKPKPRSCSASAFPYFEADAELGVVYFPVYHILSRHYSKAPAKRAPTMRRTPMATPSRKRRKPGSQEKEGRDLRISYMVARS